MTDPSSPQSATPFEAAWLTEAVRLRELAEGDVMAYADALPASDPAQQQRWLQKRARHIAEVEGLAARVQGWRRNARLVLGVLLALALISGVFAALGFFGAQNREINVLWTLIGLIGVHLVALLLWLVMLLFQGGSGGGTLGRLWLWLVEHLPQRAAPAAGPDYVMQALPAMMSRSGLGRWWLSAVTHSLWLLALGATLVVMLLALSLRSYGFVLETTILSPSVFTDFVRGFGWLPSQLGFSVPDPASIAAALDATANQSEAVRRAWSSWLAGGIVVYAIIPRLLVWALTLLRIRLLNKVLLPDLALPGYGDLLCRASQAHQNPGIVDADRGPYSMLRLTSPHPVAGRDALLIGMELHNDVSWPPFPASATRASLRVGEVVESREQRRAVLAELALSPVARLLVACDVRISPDRGSLSWLVDLSAPVGEIAVWLLGVDNAAGAREQVWRDSLTAVGLAETRIMTTPAAALRWLNHE